MIQDALKRNQWNRLAAAKDLGIHKSTLFRKIRKLNIKMPKEDGTNAEKHLNYGLVLTSRTFFVQCPL